MQIHFDRSIRYFEAQTIGEQALWGHKNFYYTTSSRGPASYSFIRKRSKLQHYWMMGVHQETRHKLTTLIGSKFEKKPRIFSVKNGLCLTLLAVDLQIY